MGRFFIGQKTHKIIKMKRKELEIYEQPLFAVAIVEVEQGFAGTGNFEGGDDWGDNVDPYEPVTPPGGEDLMPDDDW